MINLNSCRYCGGFRDPHWIIAEGELKGHYVCGTCRPGCSFRLEPAQFMAVKPDFKRFNAEQWQRWNAAADERERLMQAEIDSFAAMQKRSLGTAVNAASPGGEVEVFIGQGAAGPPPPPPVVPEGPRVYRIGAPPGLDPEYYPTPPRENIVLSDRVRVPDGWRARTEIYDRQFELKDDKEHKKHTGTFSFRTRHVFEKVRPEDPTPRDIIQLERRQRQRSNRLNKHQVKREQKHKHSRRRYFNRRQ